MDANNVSYAYINEVENGETPNGEFIYLEYTGGEGISISDSVTDSGLVTGSLQNARPALTLLDVKAGFEFNFSTHPQIFGFLAGVLSSDVLNPFIWGTSYSFNESFLVKIDASNYYIECSNVSALPSKCKTGLTLRLYDFEGISNKTLVTIKEIIGNKIYIEEELVEDISSSLKTVQTSIFIRNGTKKHTISIIEKRDEVETYQVAKGLVINSLNLQMTPNSIVTGTVSMTGFNYSISNKDINFVDNTLGKEGEPLSGFYSGYYENGLMTTSEDIQFSANSNAFSSLKSFSIDISERARTYQALGKIYNSGINLNTLAINLDLSRYFTEYSILEDYLYSSIDVKGLKESIRFYGDDNELFIITFPSVYLSGWSLSAGALNSDMEAEFKNCKLQPFTDSSNNTYVIQVEFFPSLENSEIYNNNSQGYGSTLYGTTPYGI